jgi:hypothetical protein
MRGRLRCASGEGGRRRALVRAAVALLALGAVSLVVARMVRTRRPYRERAATVDSPPVQHAVAAIRQIAAGTTTVEALASTAASVPARRAMEAAAAQIAGATAVEACEAAWFGAYLRVLVRCAVPDGKLVEKAFMFTEQDGAMAMTGVEG